MTATIHTFPGTARMSTRERIQRDLHHHQALIELLVKPDNSAANLLRQLRHVVPASSNHPRAGEVNDIITHAEDLRRMIDDLTVNLALDAIEIQRRLRKGDLL